MTDSLRSTIELRHRFFEKDARNHSPSTIALLTMKFFTEKGHAMHSNLKRYSPNIEFDFS